MSSMVTRHGFRHRHGVTGVGALLVLVLILGSTSVVRGGRALPPRPAPPAVGGAQTVRAEHLDRIPDGTRSFADGGRPVVLSPRQELARVGPLARGWVASVHTFGSGVRTRSYLVVSPRVTTPKASGLAVYVALHGRGANPVVMDHISALTSLTGPAVLVYPAGYEDSWNAGSCCGYAHADNVDDVAFIRTVVAQVLSRYPAASAGRVYVIGFSNGGRMAYRLACDLPGTFAGMAAVEAVPVAGCLRLRPLDVEIIAQRRDPLLTILDGSTPKSVAGHVEPTVQATVARWRSLDGCAGAASSRRVGDAVTRTWACRDHTRLQYTLYAGGSHVWPEGRPGRVSAGRVIVSLFGATRPPAGPVVNDA